MPLESFELPHEWRWATEWMVDKSIGTDGWVYSLDFSALGALLCFERKKAYHHFVRRRRWIRTREKLPDEERAIHQVLKKQASSMLSLRRSSRSQAELRSGRLSRQSFVMAAEVAAARTAAADDADDADDASCQPHKPRVRFSEALDSGFGGVELVPPTDHRDGASGVRSTPRLSNAEPKGADSTTSGEAGESSADAGVGLKVALLTDSSSEVDTRDWEPPLPEEKGEPLSVPQDGGRHARLEADAFEPESESFRGDTRERSYTENISAMLAKSLKVGGLADEDHDISEDTEEGKNIAVIEGVEAQLAYKRGRRMRYQTDLAFYGTSAEDKTKIRLQLKDLEQQIAQLEEELESLSLELDGVAGADDDLTPKYMRGRETIEEELEDTLDDVPFERFEIMSGQGRKRIKVGTLKAVIRVAEMGSKFSDADQRLVARLKQPKEHFIRVYILKGTNLMSHDKTGASDPYIKVRLGKQEMDNREEHGVDKTELHFLRRFDLHTQLPGISTLTIECWDYDGFGRFSDDLIGSTEVDLEDRVFSDEWQSLTDNWKVPVERRNLYTPLSQNPQGQLSMWIDIMTPEEAARQKPIDISPPPKQEYAHPLLHPGPPPQAAPLRASCAPPHPHPSPSLTLTLTLSLALT